MTNSTLTEDPVARGAALYDHGATTVFASGFDPRIAYCLYVPEAAQIGPDTRIVAVIHGTDRDFLGYRDAFAPLGRWKNCIIVSPLFPVGLFGDGNRDGYKHLREGDMRYDEALIAIVEEVAARYGIDGSRFGLWGFSGGGQFTNRFLLVHPERLWAASVGAPGSVTRIDDDHDWWPGTRDFAERFGKPLDLVSLQQLPVQMVVGKADLETWEITHQPGSKHWTEGANDAGRTRPERLTSLARSFEAAGMGVRLEIVPNMPHDSARATDRVTSFFAETLDKLRR
ncbi:MAG: alpha/beta hydrolase [Cereibacter changlensis]|uniref:Alpha/beta hydrolase n=1 Tax=Cereibacter changlensis TaxID=402884 RepID=A0A4U0YPB9_9RHOB|nr:alpha/beta hydrolase [Cereibacter changlensis]TKA94260.1 alpha/beta hydrolase [Cereibacter changlensis]